MLRDIDADYYVMVDGDDTYPAEAAPELLAPLMADEADMSVGDRLSNGTYGEENDRAFHASATTSCARSSSGSTDSSSPTS